MKHLLLSLFLASISHAQEWTRFRGPNGNGRSTTEIPAKWADANTRYKVKLPGTGHGSPVLWGDKLFLLCADETNGDRMPLCINAKDGSVAWTAKVSAGTHKKHKFNAYASTTAACDAERVYFSWGTKAKSTVAAYDHAGVALWSTELAPVNEGHGYGSSPTVYQDLVIINRDQKATGALVALDAKTGEIRWNLPRKSQRISYSCAVEYTAPGRKEELVFTNWQHGFTGVDPASGKATWERSTFNTETNERAISSPVIAGDFVIGTCGFTKNPKHCVAVQPQADGSVKEIWRLEKSIPHIPCLLVHGDRVYLWEDNAILSCVDWKTGEVMYKERLPGTVYFGSPVLAGDKIFCIDRDGLCVVVQAGDEFKLLAENDLGELCRSTPAIANGMMFVRTWEHLMAIGP